MKSLRDFQAPKDGELTLCEVDGRLHSMSYEFSNVNAFTTTVENHPKIHVTRDMLHPIGAGEEAKALFLPVEVSIVKRIIQEYYEHGFVEALKTASLHDSFLLSKGASIILGLLAGVNNIRKTFNPLIRTDGTKTINNISQTRNWQNSLIRCISWHPSTTKIAVALMDDSVRIYSSDMTLVPVLKYKQHKNISCLAWRPLSNSVIAVGCESGIFVWNVDPHSVVTRPSINNAVMLHRIGHTAITSVAWSHRGDILASCAAYDSTILVWNVELDQTSSLKRPGSSGNTMLKWSPVGDKLFSATMSVLFRVWDCQTWQVERWSVVSGRVQTACWSPCGKMVLFTTTEEPLIYALSFVKTDLIYAGETNSPNQAIPLYDLSKVDIDGIVVGGIVQNMDWDPKGNHLAVLFQDSNHVAVFSVTMKPILQINASSLIAGTPEEVPNTIEFQKNFEFGACLSIGWSSGRLQHFPIVYTDFKQSNVSLTDNRSLFNSFSSINSPNTSYF